METPKAFDCTMGSWLDDDLEMQTRTSGGFSDSDANEATVRPKSAPWWAVVTMVTPLAKWERACLNWASSTGMAGGCYNGEGDRSLGTGHRCCSRDDHHV